MATPSPKYSVNLKDAVEAALYAALSAPILVVLTSLSQGKFNINWTTLWQMAVSNLAAYLIKQYFSGPKPPTSGSSAMVAKVAGLFIVLCLLASLCKAQSIFKPLPGYKKPVPYNRFSRVIIPTDSLPSLSTSKFQGFRFAGPDVAFAVPDFSIYTGLGIDWVIAVADPATGKWAYNFTIGPRVYGGANLSTPTVKTIGAIGIRATFFKGWLALGAIYNLTTQNPQATIGNPAALIPGLN